VLKLVGVDHRTDRLHQAVGDVEGEDACHPAFGVVDHGARLPVHQGRHAVDALLLRAAEQPDHEPGDPLRPVHRLAQSPALASAVADRHHVGGEKFEQRAQVAAARSVEEAAGHLVALLAGGVEPRFALIDMVPGTDEDLTAVRLGLAGDLGDLGVVIAEDLAEQEYRAFGGRQALEQDQEGHGQGIGHLGALRGVGSSRWRQLVGDERFGQPGAHVRLPPDPRRPQVADGQPGGDGG
jgi:hypothetical protein